MTEAEPLQQVERTYVFHQGRKLAYFAGCDYFRLASHPKVLRAVVSGLNRFGLTVAASRLTTGNHAVYDELEQRLARYFKAQAAVLVPTGYLTNLVVAQALEGQFSHVYIDERVHASLLDAARFLKGRTVRFRHRDPDDLVKKMRAGGGAQKVLLMTDGMFARDGSVAPLQGYRAVLPPNSMMLVDDAHGAGVLGRHGRGTPEFERVGRERLIQTVTLSKAFGAYGGAVLCSRAVRREILEKSRIFVGSTPIPLPLAQAALASVAILEKGREVRKRLLANTAYVRQRLGSCRIAVPDHPGPIICLTPTNRRQIPALRAALLAQGVFPSFIKYPGGPATGYFRFVISSEHTRDQLDRLIRGICAAEGLSSD